MGSRSSFWYKKNCIVFLGHINLHIKTTLKYKNVVFNFYLGTGDFVMRVFNFYLGPGDFVMEKSQLYADMSTGEATATVLRHNGCDGEVKVHYTTM